MTGGNIHSNFQNAGLNGNLFPIRAFPHGGVDLILQDKQLGGRQTGQINGVYVDFGQTNGRKRSAKTDGSE